MSIALQSIVIVILIHVHIHKGYTYIETIKNAAEI